VRAMTIVNLPNAKAALDDDAAKFFGIGQQAE
jgi:hypothetical protein